MRKSNKKGFTIVELVIVIAVIAILSAVLIPTFGGIIDKANESAALQEASNAYKNYLIYHDYEAVDLADVEGYVVVDNKYYFAIDEGQFNDTVLTAAPAISDDTKYVFANDATNYPNVYIEVAKPVSGD